jgi:hypothetical protein
VQVALNWIAKTMPAEAPLRYFPKVQ